MELTDMSDSSKTCLSAFAFIGMFVFPLAALAIGWIEWDFETGAIAALVVFLVFFLFSALLLARVKNWSWAAILMPICAGLLYALLPDAIPGPVDDAAVMTVGSVLSFIMWLRNQQSQPPGQ